MSLYKIFLAMGIALVVLLYFFTGDPHEPYLWTEHRLIAHAGGGIDGKTYTNSVEAFKLNYENGFRLFEFDIAITSDNILVARHGWDDDIGQELIDGNPLKHQEFMDTFYYGQYQPMDFKMILELLEEYPDIYIILDGKVESPEDVEVLYKLVGEAVKDLDERVLARLIPQMFYENDVEVIRNYGFRDLLYVVGREEYTPESLVEFCLENDVRAVSLSVKRTNKEIVEALKEKDIKVYTYTLNDLDLMQKLLDIGVNGFFTDFINNLEEIARQVGTSKVSVLSGHFSFAPVWALFYLPLLEVIKMYRVVEFGQRTMVLEQRTIRTNSRNEKRYATT